MPGVLGPIPGLVLSEVPDQDKVSGKQSVCCQALSCPNIELPLFEWGGGGILGNVQGLLLVLFSRISPGRLRGPYGKPEKEFRLAAGKASKYLKQAAVPGFHLGTEVNLQALKSKLPEGKTFCVARST